MAKFKVGEIVRVLLQRKRRSRIVLQALCTAFVILGLAACASKKNHGATQAAGIASGKLAMPALAKPGQAIAPNTAKITAVILDRKPTVEGAECALRVLNVLGYGAATPAIAANSQLTARLPNSLLEKAVSGQTFSFAAGDTLVLSIKHFPTMKAASSPPAAWTVVTVHAQRKH